MGIENLPQAYTVTVTPNHVITQATVSFVNESHEPVVFTLYDLTGKAVQQEKTSAPQIIITNNQWSGLFIYELRFKDGRVARGKLIFNGGL